MCAVNNKFVSKKRKKSKRPAINTLNIKFKSWCDVRGIYARIDITKIFIGRPRLKLVITHGLSKLPKETQN